VHVAEHVDWVNLTYQDLEKLDRDRTVVLLPVGSIEVHGPHLPLGQDTMAVYMVSVEASRRSQPSLVLPPLYYAYVPENRHFPGTISLDGELLTRLLEKICDEVYRNGFKKILIVNGHGGNTRVLRFFLREMQEKGKRYLVYILADPWLPIQDVIGKVRETEIVGHACEIETSTSLYLFPELVRLERVTRPARLGPPQPVEGVETMADWVCYAIEGYLGDPRLASREKGRLLVERWIEGLARIIDEVRNDSLYGRVMDDFYRRAQRG